MVQAPKTAKRLIILIFILFNEDDVISCDDEFVDGDGDDDDDYLRCNKQLTNNI